MYMLYYIILVLSPSLLLTKHGSVEDDRHQIPTDQGLFKVSSIFNGSNQTKGGGGGKESESHSQLFMM